MNLNHVLLNKDIFYLIFEYLYLKHPKELNSFHLVCKDWNNFLVDNYENNLFKNLLLNYFNDELNFYNNILNFKKITKYRPLRNVCKEMFKLNNARILTLQKTLQKDFNYKFMKEFIFIYWIKLCNVLFSTLKFNAQPLFTENCKIFTKFIFDLPFEENDKYSIFSKEYNNYKFEVILNKFKYLLKNCKEFKQIIENSKLTTNFFEIICKGLKDNNEKIYYFDNIVTEYNFKYNYKMYTSYIENKLFTTTYFLNQTKLEDPFIFTLLFKPVVYKFKITIDEIIEIIKNYGAFLFKDENTFCKLLKGILLEYCTFNEKKLRTDGVIFLMKEYGKPIIDNSIVLFNLVEDCSNFKIVEVYIYYCLKEDDQLIKELFKCCKTFEGNNYSVNLRRKGLLNFFKHKYELQ